MKKHTEFKKYLSEIDMSIKDAAAVLGLSRPYLTMVVNGLPCGKDTARKIENWSNGQVPRNSLMFPNEAA